MTLFDRPLEDVLRQRWADGKKQYRPNGGGFNGNPVKCAAEEQADSILYGGEAIKQGYDREIMEQFIATAHDQLRRLEIVLDLKHTDDLSARFVARLLE